MAKIGYALSSEEHAPSDLVRYAKRAEEIGFEFALVSDHFHPWIDRQGHSPFVWNILGAIAHATDRIVVGTGVTCPTIRIHPAVLAQATATTAAMMPGRFFLGVGTGEALNEHITGAKWPPAQERLDMLEEAVEIIRELIGSDGYYSHRGRYFTVENARIYTKPDSTPDIMVAASGSSAAELAGRIGDGLISTAPQEEIVEQFQKAGGAGKPVYGQATVCWASDEQTARRTAYEWWPQTALKGQLSQELALPLYFEQACETLSEDDVASSIVCGPDAQKHIEQLKEFINAGYDHVYIHQVGPDQEGFFRFYEREILPNL